MTVLLQPNRFAAPFSPLDIAWHTCMWASGAEFAALALADGAAVATWPDEASTHDATQATGSKQPTYRAAVAAFNNKPVIEGDRVDDYLATAAFTELAQPTTIVLVGATANSDNYLFDGIVTNKRNYLKRRPSNLWEQGTSGAEGHPNAADSNAHLHIATYNGASSSHQVDGTSSSTTLGTDGLTGLTLFSYFNHDAQFGRYIAFLGVINATLTAQNKTDLRTWAQSYYGTP